MLVSGYFGIVHALLWDAHRRELVVRLDIVYKFVHDRVQEAAYSLIPEQLRAEAHVRIGRLLRAHIPSDKREETIFEIVGQFNRGAALIASLDEREQLAELNLVAGAYVQSGDTAGGMRICYRRPSKKRSVAWRCYRASRQTQWNRQLSHACELIYAQRLMSAAAR